MKRSLKPSLLTRVHSSTVKLQRAIDMHSYLLIPTFDPPDNFPKLSHTLSTTLYEPSNQFTEFDSDNPEKNSGTLQQAQQGESYHEMMRKQSRRLHSWPSIAVDAFEEDGGPTMDSVPRMKQLESTTALSLATFTSLLIEFVARLDHLVEAVEELSKMAKFKHEGV